VMTPHDDNLNYAQPTDPAHDLRSADEDLSACKNNRALSMSAAIDDLLSGDWDERWRLLGTDNRLLDSAVAARVIGTDLLLGLVIRQAASAGLSATHEQFSDAEKVAHIAQTPTVCDVNEGLAACRAVLGCDTPWAWPLVWRAIPALASQAGKIEHRELLQMAMVIQAGSHALSIDALQFAARLAFSDWDEVWRQLPNLTNLVELSRAARCLPGIWQTVGTADAPGQWAQDLADLLDATRLRGSQIAVREHQLILTARHLAEQESLSAEEIAYTSHLLAEMKREFDAAPAQAVWLLSSAITLARRWLVLAEHDRADYPGHASDLGTLIAWAVQAAVLPVTNLAEAVKWQRQSLLLLSPDNSAYPAYASNLGNSLAESVRARVLPKQYLAEAITRLREAVKLTSSDHQDYPGYASNLGAVISFAVQAAVLPTTDLNEAITWQREAVSHTSSDHRDYPMYASNLGSHIAGAIHAGVLPKQHLAEAVAQLRESVRLANSGDLNYSMYASNLGSVIREAVHAGVLPKQDLTEAVAQLLDAVRHGTPSHVNYAGYLMNLNSAVAEAVQAGVLPQQHLADSIAQMREAVRLTSSDDINYPLMVSNLSSRIAEATKIGMLSERDLVEAIALQRTALQLTDSSDPNYPMYASNLGSRIAEAFMARVLPKQHLAEAVILQRLAVQLTSPDNPNYPGYASNLGNQIADAVWAGVLPKPCLAEAVRWQREAFTHTEPDHTSYAGLASNLGSQIAEAVECGVLPAENLTEAVVWLREAVRLTAPDQPDYPGIVSNLGTRLAQAVEADVLDAESAAQECVALVDRLWQMLRWQTATPTERRAAINHVKSFLASAAWLVLGGADAAAALVVIESLRGLLVSGRRAPELSDEAALPEGVVLAYRAAATEYDRGQLLAREGIVASVDAARRLEGLRSAIEQVRAQPGWETFAGQPTVSSIAAHLPAETVCVYLLAGPNAGAAVVLLPNGSVQQYPLVEVTEEKAIRAANLVVSASPNPLPVAMWLYRVLKPLLCNDEMTQACWWIVPTGKLSALPWHAANRPDGASLDDHVRACIVPSLTRGPVEALLETSGQPLVVLTAPDLIYAEGDLAVAQRFWRGSSALEGRVNADALLEGLRDAPRTLISGHANTNSREGSALYLGGADGESLAITPDMIDRLPARSRGVAILSSCFSGVPGVELSEEFLGIPNSLLAAGFQGVFATGWPVADRVAFVTLARLLQTCAEHPDADGAESMRSVRRWLRGIDTDSLRAWFADLVGDVELPVRLKDDMTQWLDACATTHPFEDPIDWAAFFYIGW